MKLVALLSILSAALSYAGIPVEIKRALAAALGISATLLAVYHVLRYGPLVAGIERRAAQRSAAKTKVVEPRAARAVEQAMMVPIVAPAAPTQASEVSDMEDSIDEEPVRRVAISRSSTARPPRARRTAPRRETLVTMLPAHDEAPAVTEADHA